MKITDVIFALICGRVVAWIAHDFITGYGVEIGLYKLLLDFLLPVLAVVCLWIAYKIGRKLLFVYQAAKHILVGVFATVVDLKFFELLTWLFSFVAVIISPVVSKAISFLISTSIKYWGNKHWAFGVNEENHVVKEFVQFLIITFVGLLLDISSFFYFTNILGPQFSTPEDLWVKLSVLFAAVVAAIWNFLGYKFIVFKK